ncbi:MAG: hypothetical protein AAF311_04090 [Pseudomonadota bacterium]
MKQTIAILASIMMVGACSTETSADTSDTASHEGAPSEAVIQMAQAETKPAPRLGFGNRDKKFIESMEAGFENQMKLYSRVSPEAAALVKPVKLNDEDRETIRCVIREMKSQGMEKYLDLGIETNAKLNKMINDNPDLSMKTIESYPEAMDLLMGGGMMDTMSEAESEKSMAINKECGTMAMMMEKMHESGIMAAMQADL